MDVSTSRLPYVWQRCLDGVVCAELFTSVNVGTNIEYTSGRTVSISSTVLNPFSDRPEIGTRKFPAAPSRDIEPKREQVHAWYVESWERERVHTADDKVDAAKLLDGFRDSVLQRLRLPHVRLCGDTCSACVLRQLLRCRGQAVKPA